MIRKSRTRRTSGLRPITGTVILGTVSPLLFLMGILAWFSPPAHAQGISIISERTEKNLGKRMDPQVLRQFGYYRDPFLQDYVRRLGRRIARLADKRGFRYQFKVVGGRRENAFALPGGYIYITRGMLATLNSEAQLAGVLGHEIAHVTQRHGARQMTKALGAQILTLVAAAGGAMTGAGGIGPAITVTQAIMGNIMRGHGREFEFEADEKGLYYARKAGYDPREAAHFMRRLRQLERLRGIGYHGFGATHPETTMRILKLEELAENLVRPGEKLKIEADKYKAQLSGLVYGERKERLRIRIYTAKAGESLRDIANDIMGNPNLALEIALLNGIEETARLRTGQKVKLLVRR